MVVLDGGIGVRQLIAVSRQMIADNLQKIAFSLLAHRWQVVYDREKEKERNINSSTLSESISRALLPLYEYIVKGESSKSFQRYLCHIFSRKTELLYIQKLYLYNVYIFSFYFSESLVVYSIGRLELLHLQSARNSSSRRR